MGVHDSLTRLKIETADDLGSKDIGWYGGPVKKPVLDRLAAKLHQRFKSDHRGRRGNHT